MSEDLSPRWHWALEERVRKLEQLVDQLTGEVARLQRRIETLTQACPRTTI